MEPNSNLSKSLESLLGNHSFQTFLAEVTLCRDLAVKDASRLDLIECPMKIASLMGEVRAYQQILDVASVD